MRIAKILLPVSKLFPLDYLITEDLELNIGDLVVVHFRNKELTGIVWELDTNSEAKKIKTIEAKAPLNLSITLEVLELIKWMSSYYMSELGSIAKLVLPINISEKPIKIKEQQVKNHFVLPKLSEEQKQAVTILNESNKPTLIKGVTGSGKTEIYFHIIADYLIKGRQVLIMLPEIALGKQIINRFIDRFGFEPIIWNSSVTKAQKKMILRGILSNKVKVVIGTRSSLFLPFHNLGLIVIDEEHDDSYKQDDNILYNARDTAIVRGKFDKAKIVLCSATPSLETIYNIKTHKYQLVTLANRYKNVDLPNIEIIDMTKEKLPKNSYLSKILIDAIKGNLENKKQALLFLNRRGYAPLMLCKACGHRFTCKFCSAWMVLHKATKKLECHHCGYQSKIFSSCPECLEDETLTICGPGIERIAEEAMLLFPKSKIAVISKDHAKTPEKIAQLLHQMENLEIDILIGTQIITKGYHFPNLTLVGVIDADLGSNNAELRASERTFQLLHQVGGRAGRGDSKGVVYLQSYYPDNIIFSYVKVGDEDRFFTNELEIRKAANMPPFSKTASLILSGFSESKILDIARKIVQIAPKANVKILGPARSLMSKLAGKYRYRILIIADKKFNLQKYLKFWLGFIKIPSYCQIKIDIDPKTFY
ncbi:primosomal protein N' [Rickettsia prowazekii]|uniref:Replication restart protein PriA n=2 Tax=Rickettsia prowazekii TaxID=782 RepID=PRIA_RICPR|nr:primosomal protein N' [Rickettsia prowazekii]Q9ZD10.1 RecName: Full=Primosomal protein N'; AltName: Full=ATP-dependent helicase PriA [Rickettsia prowazekii str. Madrid E]EOB09912.1 Primosomal protein N' [Rickettsia prowazekii str. GvF12]ADE30070.1 Primosomal protein N' [Rickettsia prowazekii str. Rp22]AFE49344.1 primosome assembly protein PriA [Rickettsia prowazekii str. Chernikova]AFE50188.1 primosome assembly protein PriA [Rickettsia prowazekii str. Katsinyian]AFE51034.1 primosome assemb